MLRLVEVAEAKNVQREFEFMGKGLVLLRVTVGGKTPSPYHWILEDGRKPGLDVSFHPTYGSLSYLKFFLQDEKVKVEPLSLSVNELSGLPVFEMTEWSESQYYVTEHGTVESVFDGRNLYLIRTGYIPLLCIRVNQSFSMLFADNKAFSGVIFHNIGDDEIQSLKDAGPL